MLRKILIVDDNEINLKILHGILNEGYEVIEAEDGRSALDVLRRDRDISAVLLDIVMPVMDGYEVLRQMQSDDRLSSIPVIVSTGLSDGKAELKALGLGATDFILKPYEPALIRHRLRNILKLIDDASDATAQRVTAEERAKNYEKLQTIITDLNSGISAVTIDPEGVVHYAFANDAYYSIIGYTREQIETEVGNSFDILHPDDVERIRAVVDEVISSRQPNAYEYRIIRGDGETRTLRCSASVTGIEGVSDSVLLSVISDITELENAEKQTALASSQLKLLAENMPGGIAVMQIGPGSLHISYFNEGFYGFSGYTADEYRTMTAEDPLCLVFKEDAVGILSAVEQLRKGDNDIYCTYRCHTKDGSYRWFDMKGSVAERCGDMFTVNLVQFDVTERKEAEESLRISEEQFRIAASAGGRVIARYDIKTGVYHHNDRVLKKLGFGETVENMPQTFIDAGMIAPECIEDYIDYYKRMSSGEKTCSADCMLLTDTGQFRWAHMEANIIFDAAGEPSQAIVISMDITEQREKEAVYKKWQQSLQQKPKESYTLIRWNISKESMWDEPEGSLLSVDEEIKSATFNEFMFKYSLKSVLQEDRESYLAFADSDVMLANYHRGKRIESLVYREARGGDYRWLRLTVELVEYPNSSDVAAYLMYEDIDSVKREEMMEKERADRDPLTGVLNRAAFAAGMEDIIRKNRSSQHVLFMLDVDCFKQLNDTFGHAAGDQALIDIAEELRSVLRHGDLIGRLGGDEFLICMKSVPFDPIIEKKAGKICSIVRRSYSADVRVSVSVGISVYPRDGESFDLLYRRADKALYSVKEKGKDSFAFFKKDMNDNDSVADREIKEPAALKRSSASSKRRILIVDDDEISRRMLAGMFKDRFIVEMSKDGNEALMRMRHYGAGIAVVLLDLVMPGLDGFGVLDAMRDDKEMRTIPVIVVSGADDHRTGLDAIRRGALDFVAKPVDRELIQMCVDSAISRADNERLRAQNSYLLLQSSEEAKYHTVLESTGTVVIEYDWISGAFAYEPSAAEHISGAFDDRKLWHILLSDMIADAMDVKAMQSLVHDVANDRNRASGSLVTKLKTPSGEKHWFRMNVFKRADAFRLTDKMILTFNDINEEVLSNEKLHFQAERDELTGLYNRRTFLQKAEETANGKPAGEYIMAVGDIDNFKIVNDRFGHEEGDKLLRLAADRLLNDVRKSGGVCGRLGGDVFAVLVPNTAINIKMITEYPKTLLENNPFDAEVTCSVGFYTIDEPSMSADGMLDRASIAKHTVKGKYDLKAAHYDENMRKNLLKEQDITDKMEAALANRHFDIYLQPQYDHVTGRICGAETLVRWLHPDKGVVFLPGEFIPLFERSGFITQLDAFVWDRTAELFGKRLRTGQKTVPVSVNVSRLDTHDPLLCEKLLGITGKHDIPTGLFRLEITESLFEEDSERLIKVIDKLHDAGFIIEMDDFGSGYSSLNILKDVKVDILKLDMQFFSDTSNKERSCIILNAIMRMARWLGIPVIAEGVETKEQADYLASIGCHTVQGYLYAKPMPVREFEKLLSGAKTVSPHGEPTGRLAAPATAALWSVETADSQMFYNYMDAAVIYEYSLGHFEALRVNRRFTELLGFDGAAPLPSDAPLGMSDGDVKLFYAATERAIESGADETVEIKRVSSVSGENMRLLCRLRVMPGDGNAAVVLCTVTDITPEQGA